jgi:DNA-binding MarR family transcriptional regulator
LPGLGNGSHPNNVRSAQVVEALLQVIRMAKNNHSRLAGVLGIDPDRSVLIVLSVVAEFGPLFIGHIADRTGLSPSVVSKIVASLSKAGLVESQGFPTDKRAKWVSITEEGKHRLSSIKDLVYRFVDDALSNWSDLELSTLAALLSRLNKDLEGVMTSGGSTNAARETELSIRVRW